MTLTVGQRLTLLKIDDALAMTHRYELELRQLLTPEAVGFRKTQTRLAVVRQRGKRKEFYLDLDTDEILLDGWDVPFRADTECGGVFSGNACFNLVGDPDLIRSWIETRAVVPVRDEAKAKILFSREPRMKCGDDGELLYPDIDTHHAIVNRVKNSLRIA